MQTQEIEIKGYRSIFELNLKLSHANVFTGANGCGKSNLFIAFRLAKSAVDGNLSEHIAKEGGMSSIMWAGPSKVGPKKLSIRIKCDPFEYYLELGLRPASQMSLFPLDPQIKQEKLSLAGRVMLDRGSSVANLRGFDTDWKKQIDLIDSESVFSQISDAERYTFLYTFRDAVARWTFYHEFRTDSESSLRRPSIGSYSTKFKEDGSNLAPALFMIVMLGENEQLMQSVESALPQSKIEIYPNKFVMNYDGIVRPFEMREISDGTLKFLCLAAACYFPHPPPLLVFNEPESSLNESAIIPLAQMLAHSNTNSQLWIPLIQNH